MPPDVKTTDNGQIRDNTTAPETGGGAGNIDGGAPDTVYLETTPLDGGTP